MSEVLEQEFNEWYDCLALKHFESFRVKNGFQESSTFALIDDPINLECRHSNWVIIVIFILKALSHIILVVDIVNVWSIWSDNADYRTGLHLTHFESLLVLHLNSLEWEAIHVWDELLVVNKVWKDVTDSFGISILDVRHELQENVHTSIVTLSMS